MVRSASFLLSLALSLVCVVGEAVGQSAFLVRLSGDQVVPASAAAETGDGFLVLDPVSGRVTYSVELSGASSPVTGAALHLGAPGQNGTVLFALAGGGTEFEGESAPLSPGEIGSLRDGATHVLVTTAAQPTGALRGQVCAAWNEFLVDADGATALPPSGSAGSASGVVNITEDGLLQVGVTATGLSGPITGGALRRGSPGGDLGLIAQIPKQATGGDAFLQGVVGPLSEADQAWIRAGRAWLTVATAAFPDTPAQPGGEVRGGARPWQYPYGEGSGPSASSTPLLLNLLPWRPGGLVDIYLLNDSLGLVQFQFGWLLVAPTADVAALPGGGSLLVDLPTSVAVPVPGDTHNVQAFLPAVLPPAAWLQMQFLGLDSSGQVLASSGVSVLLDP